MYLYDLDREIAELLRAREIKRQGPGEMPQGDVRGWSCGDIRGWLECPRYSVEIEAAFFVVEFMRERGYRFEISALNTGADLKEYVGSFRLNAQAADYGHALSPAECICLAALAAIRTELKWTDALKGVAE